MCLVPGCGPQRLAANFFSCYVTLHSTPTYEKAPPLLLQTSPDLIMSQSFPALYSRCRVMGLAGVPTAGCVLFMGGHIAASTVFYVHVVQMSWTWALFRVSSVLSLPAVAGLVAGQCIQAAQAAEQHRPFAGLVGTEHGYLVRLSHRICTLCILVYRRNRTCQEIFPPIRPLSELLLSFRRAGSAHPIAFLNKSPHKEVACHS